MNGDHDLFDTMFRWGMGISGAVITAVTLGGGRKLIALDREVGELKAKQAGMDTAMTQLNEKVDKVDSKLDRVLEHLIKGIDP